MISKKTKYALRAMLYLAKEHEKGPVLIEDIAQEENIPKKFLEAILLELKNRGILASKRGKGGGYVLSRLPKDIMVGTVIRIVEGPLAPVPCVSQTAYRRCDDCKDESCCGIRFVMKEVRDATAKILDSTSLADVLNQVNQLAGKEAINYFI